MLLCTGAEIAHRMLVAWASAKPASLFIYIEAITIVVFLFFTESNFLMDEFIVHKHRVDFLMEIWKRMKNGSRNDGIFHRHKFGRAENIW